MNVLLLNDMHGYSGAEVIFNSIGDELQRRGHSVAKVTVEELGRLPDIVEAFKPDVLHQHNATRIGAATLAFMRRFPAVQTFHDYWPVCRMRDHFIDAEGRPCPELDRNQVKCGLCPNYLISLRSPTFIKAMWGRNTHIIFTAVSEYVAQKVRDYGYEEVHAIHNGIALEEDVDDTSDDGYIFIPARADHRAMKKGIPIVDHIAGELSRYRFIHAGGGNWRNMEEVGFVSRKEIMGYLRRCSLAIIPSIWEEPNGLPCQEAMQYGKVILGFSWAGGIPEYIKCFPVESPEAMKEAIVRLMGDGSSQYTTMRQYQGGLNREKFLKLFTLEKMVDRYLLIYERAIQKFQERYG